MTCNRKVGRWLSVIVFVLGVGVPQRVWGCPDCQNALAANQLDLAFAVSIMFMMSVPFLIFGGWIWAIWRMRVGMQLALVRDEP